MFTNQRNLFVSQIGAKWGIVSQYVFVIPPLDMVVVFTSGLPESLFPMPNQLVRNYLIPAAKEDGPLIPHSQVPQWLADRVRAIEQGEPHDSVLPEIAQRITGKTFRADQVPPGGMYVAFTLTFTGEGTYQNKIQFPGGESLDEVRSRILAGLEELLLRHQDENFVLVAHRVPNKVICCALIGLDNSHFWRIQQDTASTNLFIYRDGQWIISFLNDTSYLKPLGKKPLADF